MPYELQNAPGIFQRTTDTTLSDFKWQIALFYINDSVVFSEFLEEHIKHIRNILTLHSGAGASLKIEQCHFFGDFINSIEHVICPRRLKVASNTTKAIRNHRTLTSLPQIRSFLGLCSVFCRFAPNFARIAALLNK